MGQVQSIIHVVNAECHMDMTIISEIGFGNEALYLYVLNCRRTSFTRDTCRVRHANTNRAPVSSISFIGTQADDNSAES